MRLFPETLQKIIAASDLNPNNISQASGISNAYLAKLMKGGINRPGKDKIASILIALNHTITEINRILSQYDYQPLHLDDIPAILKNNRARKIIGGNLPQYDHIYFDLLLVVLERIGGNRILVKNRPSGVFMPHELYLMKEYPYESNDQAALFRYHLTRHILQERMEIFQDNLAAHFRLDTYICRACLEEYVERNIGGEAQRHSPVRTSLTVQYFANALSLALKRPEEHQTFIIERCPYFHFMIQDADGATPKVSYPGRKLHVFDNEYDKRMLEGFTTDLPHIVSHFRHEIDMCKGATDAAQRQVFPHGFVERIVALFARHGLAGALQDQLSLLMEQDETTLF